MEKIVNAKMTKWDKYIKQINTKDNYKSQVIFFKKTPAKQKLSKKNLPKCSNYLDQ